MQASGQGDRLSVMRFGEFVVDVADRRLLYRRRVVDLRRKAWEVLRYLVERPGRLVRRDELLDELWGAAAVTPQVLTNVIRELRVALRDNARRPRWIETVYTEGYRFIAVANSGDEGARDAPAPLFVGRREERTRLATALRRAIAGERQVVFVTGDPGIGKTALCQHFLAALGDQGEVRVATGHCFDQHGQSEPYMPVFEAIEALAVKNGPALVSLLLRCAPTWFAEMPRLTSGEVPQRLEVCCATPARMLREGAAFLESMGEDACLVLVLEDLHWADMATLDLLSALAQRSGRARLLVLATVCPAATAALPAVAVMRKLTRRQRASEIRLGPLDSEAIRSYLAERLTDAEMARCLAARLERASGGNPLALRSLADRLVAQRAAALPLGELAIDGLRGWLDLACEPAVSSAPAQPLRQRR